eukprot:CAMPEP_0183297652 /NCGR_PEP_ID=MMETSP0160_2-20130417/4886_1 /TAXON_ID=2839 ORGANISM="Odontella Sinensis, Strain Grunow 1884" /NCGR_SAMPLE_ID=MMETSP0160_2 /ASSEMBLY_ACC=CAM_ASM_000250 /LENGTH=121 /DNA_ID=CAMNT_0025459519 /DNA_START=178 /DNA_END=541 /DNA_ORIENTATION=+
MHLGFTTTHPRESKACEDPGHLILEPRADFRLGSGKCEASPLRSRKRRWGKEAKLLAECQAQTENQGSMAWGWGQGKGETMLRRLSSLLQRPLVAQLLEHDGQLDLLPSFCSVLQSSVASS